jgi:hypothetical protein
VDVDFVEQHLSERSQPLDRRVDHALAVHDV